MVSLNDLRNRVAHHEHLLKTDVAGLHGDLLELCEWLSPNVSAHIAKVSEVPALLAARP